MKADFKTLETAMKNAMARGGALELRGQRALIALLEKSPYQRGAAVLVTSGGK